MNGFKTYVGIVIALAPTVAHLFGYTLTPSFTEQFPETVDTIVQLLGLAFATYGRLVATAPGWLSKEG